MGQRSLSPISSLNLYPARNSLLKGKLTMQRNPNVNPFTQWLLYEVAALTAFFSLGLVSAAQAYAMTPTDNEVAANSSKATITDNNVDFSMMVTAHSPAQPISAFIDDWDAPLDSGDHAYLQGRVAVNVRPAGSAISYGLGWRYDYLMQFSEETAQVYWQYENKVYGAPDKTYPLYLQASYNERIGANIGYSYPINTNWQLAARTNIWQGLHALDGKINGQLTSQAIAAGANIRDSVNNAESSVDYYYDKPALGEENLGWLPDKPKGLGYSFDVQLAGKLTPTTTLNLQGYDLLGRMQWHDMPSTRYALDYDVGGRPLYTLEGQLDSNDVTQDLPWRIEGSLLHQLDSNWQLGAYAQANDIQTLYQLSAGYNLDNNTLPVTITGIIEPQTSALGVMVDSKYGGIKLLTDDLKADKAKRSEVSLYGRYVW